MRLDKWLKVSRLIKRRTVAQAACDGGRVLINERVAKPASTVRPGDALLLDLGRQALQIEVLQVPAGNVPAPRAAELYKVVRTSETRHPRPLDVPDDDEEEA